LHSDATRTTVDSTEARQTLDMFKTWFDEDLCPDNTSLKGQYVDLIFPSQTIAMISAGSFLVPSLETDVTRFEYGATYLPQDRGMSTDLGGNAVVATQLTEKPELAARFLEFLANEQNMKRFCEATNLLPTRNDLVEQKLDYEIQPDLIGLIGRRGRQRLSAGHTTGAGALVLLQSLPERGEGEAHVGPHPGLPLGEEHQYHVL
jgi:multiple sugar transport system substrate-binding protein